jgi:allantoinase
VLLPDLVVRSRRVVVDRGTRAAALHVRDGRIIGVLDFEDVPPGCPLDDAGGLVVMPGVVDLHVRAGGRDGTGAGFEAVTRAAAAGGVTTLVDVPVPHAGGAGVSALEARRRAAAGRCFVDVGFWGDLVPHGAPDVARRLAELREAGALGFNCVWPSANARDVPRVSEADLRVWMPALTRLGAMLVADDVPFPLLAQLCREHRTRTHVVHLSSSEGLTPLFQARAAGLPMTAETWPLYLCLVGEDLRARHAAAIWPPVLGREHREFLWAALANGLIQGVASGDAVQVVLSATWTEAAARGYRLEQLVDWLCASPSRLAGLNRKGAIRVGYDADLIAFDPDGSFTFRPTPTDPASIAAFSGRQLLGTVERTYLSGKEVYSRAKGFSLPPRGRLLA